MSTPTVIQSCAALYGIVPGAAGVTFVNGQIGTGKAFATEDAMLNHYYEATFTVWAPKTTAQVADLIVANLGLTGATATSEAARIAGLLDGVAMPARGAKVKEIVTAFEATPAAATFNAAKAALVTAVADPTYQGIPGKGVGELVFASLSPAQIQLGTSEAINTVLLTTVVDTVPGTTGVDVIKGTVSSLQGTLQATDVIDGAAGNDRLELAMGLAWGGFSTGSVKNVETVALTSTAGSALTFSAAGTSGVENFSVDGTTAGINLTNLPTGIKSISLSNLKGSSASTTFTTDYVATASEVSGTTTALNFNVTNVGGSSATTKVVATIGSVETITLGAAGTNFVDIGGTTATKLNVTGSGAVTIASVPNITSFDGSAATGKITLTVPTTITSTITSVKTGAGEDALTIPMNNLSPSATIDGGSGKDTLSLSGTGITSLFTMTGVKQLNVNVTGTAVTIAGSKISDLETVTTRGTDTGVTATGGTVTLAAMGAKNLAFVSTGPTASTVDSDHTGTTTLNYKAAATVLASSTKDAASNPTVDYTFSETSSLVVNTEAYVNTTTSDITANKATSVVLNVASGKSSSGTEQTAYDSTITANKATSVTVNAEGSIDSLALVAPVATSVNITNGEAEATPVTFTGATTAGAGKLTNLTLKSGSALTFTPGGAPTVDGLQTLTIAADKGATTFSAHPLPKVNTVILSGATSTPTADRSTVTIGNLGSSDTAIRDYGLTIEASGLRGGLTIGDVAMVRNTDLSAKLGVSGNVTIGKIGTIGTTADTARDVIVTAPGVTNGTITIGGVSGGISASGTVTIDASGATKALIGHNDTSSTGIEGNAVTVNVSGSSAQSKVGTVTAVSSANLTLDSLRGNTNTIEAAATSTSLAVTVVGGIGNDAITINATGSTNAAVTVAGDLVTPTGNTLTVNATGAVAHNINISAFKSYTASTISGGSKADTIVGGAGKDTFIAGNGADSLTGGAGADVFYFNVGDSTATSVVTIADFSKADGDVIQTGHAALKVHGGASTGSSVSAATNGITATLDLATYAVGFSGATSSSTLAQYMAAVRAVPALDANGEYAFFTFGGATHMFVYTAAESTDMAIQLVGVPLPATAAMAGTIGTDAPTGLSGIGA